VPPRPAGQFNGLLPLGDWVRHHTLRSWLVMLFLLLICVPSIALTAARPNRPCSASPHSAMFIELYPDCTGSPVDSAIPDAAALAYDDPPS